LEEKKETIVMLKRIEFPRGLSKMLYKLLQCGNDGKF
jgi:hypothetical protein